MLSIFAINMTETAIFLINDLTNIWLHTSFKDEFLK